MKPLGFKPYSNDEKEILNVLNYISPNDIPLLYKALESHGWGWVLTAINKRLSLYEIEVDKSTQIFILTLGDGIIGKCVQILDHAVKYCINKNIKTLTLDILSKDIYQNQTPIFLNS